MSEVKPSLQYVLISKVLCIIENKAYSEPHVSCALLVQIGPQLELKENAHQCPQQIHTGEPFTFTVCVHMHMIMYTHTYMLTPSRLLAENSG